MKIEKDRFLTVFSEGCVRVRIDYSRRESAVEYSIDGDMWVSSPFQAADFGYNDEEVFAAVSSWIGD